MQLEDLLFLKVFLEVVLRVPDIPTLGVSTIVSPNIAIDISAMSEV